MSATVWQLPCKSQEFDQGPMLRQDPGDQVAIAYDFEQQSGEYGWEEMLFTGVISLRFTSSRYCSEEQVGAYDKVEVVDGSAWSAAVLEAPLDLQHYRIYFDDVGCYEILATGFVPPHEGCECDPRLP